MTRTTCEREYDQLEPWIQWVSVHTGKSLADHGIYRLGDIAGSAVPQFFEQLEDRGLTVGAVSPMNAANRLRSPAYFLPDPWTVTPSDGSWWSRMLGEAVSQAVNDNAQGHMQLRSAAILFLGLLRFARAKNYGRYLRLAMGSRRAPWRKALFLDLFLHDLHLRLLLAKRPNLSVAFLNGGAHIQHHYFFNSRPIKTSTQVRNPDWYVHPEADPVAEMVGIYDGIVSEYLTLPDCEVIVATGLSQKPYDRVKFYYRLRNHAEFLRLVHVPFRSVIPRMTRDFLIEFDDPGNALSAQARLSAITAGPTDAPLFGEIDNRGTSLFVTLSYAGEITADTEYAVDGVRQKLADHVAFVALKNGMHQDVGFACFSRGIAHLAPNEGAHVKHLYESVVEFFA